MDTFKILLIISIFTFIYNKQITKFLVNKKILTNDFKLEQLTIIAVLLLITYFAMTNKKESFSAQYNLNTFTKFFTDMVNEGLGLQTNAKEPVEHEHPAGPDENHIHGGGEGPTVIRHSHIIETPTVTPAPL